VRASLNERAAARQLYATILGLKVMSKAGASPEALRDVALTTLEGMAGPPAARARERWRPDEVQSSWQASWCGRF